MNKFDLAVEWKLIEFLHNARSLKSIIIDARWLKKNVCLQFARSARLRGNHKTEKGSAVALSRIFLIFRSPQK